MFKNIKSALIYYHIYKFRKRLTTILLLLMVTIFSQFIYNDIVEYLTLREKLDYLDYILPAKWALVFICLGVSIYLFLTIFKSEKVIEKEKSEVKAEDQSREKFSEREKKFLHKDKLQSKADRLVERTE